MSESMITDIYTTPLGISVLPDGKLVQDLQLNVEMTVIMPMAPQNITVNLSFDKP